MSEITYVGESLLPGAIGRFSVILAFVAALLAMVSYFFATNAGEDKLHQSWRRIGRFSFLFHGIGIIGIVGALFYIILNHLFEYHYAWQHSSTELPTHYVLSAFWEGQEGSFLLWSFWHAVLGGVLIFTAKKWESPVMSIISLTQVFLGSMLLGIYVFGYKIGSNPFMMLRHAMDAPIFSRPDYLQFVTDGTGLNPLLQNYWMTIHPPTLFLGFAATVVPFAFALSGLWTKDYKGWVKPALPWTLFGTMVLGTGILMGAAWAYEALSFGGFWAWDPVENASLVPWLTLVAGLHTLVIFRHTGHGLRATIIFFVLTFLLILYSTFLTRSGILGDTSVHSFTDMGMEKQLLLYMVAFVIPSVWLLVREWKNIPSPKKEESLDSREFWMFIGALVLLLSAVQITATTSIPVYNAIFGTNIAPPTDPIAHYNDIQIWVAIIIAMLAACIQYLRYKNSDMGRFFKAIGLAAVVALVATVFVAYFIEIYQLRYLLMFFAALFSVVANFDYIFIGIKGKLRFAGGSIAHVGFGLILIGVLISNHKQEVISINRAGIDFGKEFDEKNKRENVLLKKGVPTAIADYVVTYEGDSAVEPNIYYKVRYEKIDEETMEPSEIFYLYPNAQINPRMGLIANPDTRHYLDKDIYTHVTSVPDKSQQEEEEAEFETHTLNFGDTFYTSRNFVVLEGLNPAPSNKKYEQIEGDIAVGAKLTVHTLGGESYPAEPVYIIRDRNVEHVDDELSELGLSFRLMNIKPETEEMVLGVWEKEPSSDFIIMKAIVFPYINVLWAGCLIMVFGFVVSIIRRRAENKRSADRAA